MPSKYLATGSVEDTGESFTIVWEHFSTASVEGHHQLVTLTQTGETAVLIGSDPGVMELTYHAGYWFADEAERRGVIQGDPTSDQRRIAYEWVLHENTGFKIFHEVPLGYAQQDEDGIIRLYTMAGERIAMLNATGKARLSDLLNGAAGSLSMFVQQPK